MSTSAPDHAAIRAALELLGLDSDATWRDVVQAHRRSIRLTHPDLAGSGREASEQTIALNAARAILESATEGGLLGVATLLGAVAPSARRSLRRSGGSGPIELHTKPGDPFVNLLEAAYSIGDVSYIDPEAGLIQVLLESGHPAAAQLLISVDVHADPPSASFTLDTMGSPDSFPIMAVVDRLAAALEQAPA